MSDNLITTDDLNGIEKAKLMEIINDIKTGNILTMSISISWNIYPRHTTSISNKNPCVYKVTHANCGIFYSIRMAGNTLNIVYLVTDVKYFDRMLMHNICCS